MTAIEIIHEPLTYERFAERSYFKDLALAGRGDQGSEARLQRHAEEMRTVIPEREAEREQRARAAGLEYRVNPNRTDGQGGYFSAPVWLIDHFATAPRTGRVLSALIPNLPLPLGASEVKLPRLTTGTIASPTADLTAAPSRDIVDAAASQPVTPFAGVSDVALQLLEQSPAGAHLDWAIFKDLTANYDYQLELALLNGAGTGAAFTGLLNLATGAGGVSAVAYADASPTVPELMPFLGQAFGQLGDARLLPPEVWLMRSARWAWISSSDVNLFVAEPRLVGRPVVMDDAIPATLGAGTEDAIIAIRPSDNILLESAQHTEVMLEPLSGVMMARLRLHGYATAIYRYPTGIAKITGSGLAAVSGF
jgi:HK97 family phage major capsid protein